MLKEEFEELVGKKVTQNDYDDIQTVYTFYPTLSEVEGKNQIAYLYRIHGMRLIKDMLPTAKKAAEYEDMIMKEKNNLELLTNEFDDFKRGFNMKKYDFSTADLIVGDNHADLLDDGEFIAEYLESLGGDWWMAVGRYYAPGSYEPNLEIDRLTFRVEPPDEDLDYPNGWTTGQIFRLPWEEYYLG